MNTAWRRCIALLPGGALAAIVLAGCGGGSHFKDRPRPPVPLQITGVITAKEVTISPNHIGGGPIQLLISNQTQEAQTVVLERSGNQGEPNRDVVGPVNPLQTAALQQNLTQGEYTVSANSSADGVAQAIITVGPPRPSSSGTLLLP